MAIMAQAATLLRPTRQTEAVRLVPAMEATVAGQHPIPLGLAALLDQVPLVAVAHRAQTVAARPVMEVPLEAAALLDQVLPAQAAVAPPVVRQDQAAVVPPVVRQDQAVLQEVAAPLALVVEVPL